MTQTTERSPQYDDSKLSDVLELARQCIDDGEDGFTGQIVAVTFARALLALVGKLSQEELERAMGDSPHHGTYLAKHVATIIRRHCGLGVREG